MNRYAAVPIACIALLLCTSMAGPALGGDFIDTRLSFVFSENNFFAGPGETMVNSPGFGIGADKSNTLFFDNYDTRFSGFETMSHLVLYKKLPAFFDNLMTEASLVVRFRILGEDSTDIYDAGSYIRLTYDLSAGSASNKNVQLVLFPVSGDRFRLGYSYKISWGGSGIFPLNYGLVPAAKLQFNWDYAYGFVGMKTSQINEHVGDTEQTELVTNYGVLGGGGVDIEGIRAEVNGGYFTRGVFQHEGVRGEPIYGFGMSYQVGYHMGMPIGSSIDFKLYENDPDREIKFFSPEEYGTGLSFVVKHEGSFLWQTLEDPDLYGTTVNQMAMAFDVNAALKWGYLRVHLDAMYRTLSFLLYEVPSFTPYQEFPDAAEAEGEFFAALGADYHLASLRLTPGIKFGVQKPATFTIENLNVGGAEFAGKRTVVVRDVASRSILPVNEGAALIWSVKANVKWDISEILALVGEVYFTWDDNQVRYVSDFYGLNIYSTWADAQILGVNLAAQARF
ncbi:MAG: hypothetical protein JXR96_21515 [Deltaproteobacteria bacterium]|nr:hypothetical protein [Deltaproteobacteria bacterium]